ncbi:ATP-binding protein, partial [Streptomyces sp. G44]|nr:ATP-binding protein [Streptomyces sp. G44]
MHTGAGRANTAALPGHVPGTRFGLALQLPATDPLRIGVPAAGGARPPPSTVRPPLPEAEAGRGLLLVEALA